MNNLTAEDAKDAEEKANQELRDTEVVVLEF